MKKLLIFPILFILSCSTEPQDCAGVTGGSASIDDCGFCTGGTTGNLANYLQDCAGVCGGDAIEDDCGICIDDNYVYNYVMLWGKCYNIETTDSLNISNGGDSDTLLTGNIPSEIGDLVNLKKLYLDRNRLSGTIPDELYSLTNLEHLYLYGNELTGQISSEISKLNQLKELMLNDNDFNGQLPIELWTISSLNGIWIQNNNFSGEISNSIGYLSTLKHLNIQNNQFSGNIPNEICNLDLPYDALNSTYTWYYDSQLWKFFDISNNKFCIETLPYCLNSEEYIGIQQCSNSNP